MLQLNDLERHTLLVAGRANNPQCFQNGDVSKDGIKYRHTTNALMTNALFYEYLANLTDE